MWQSLLGIPMKGVYAVLELMNDNDLIVGQISHTTLRDWLKRILESIGVKDVNNYSFHSFRRGGAHLASMRGISDSTIKAHGRWRSEVYLRYVVVDRHGQGNRSLAHWWVAGMRLNKTLKFYNYCKARNFS